MRTIRIIHHGRLAMMYLLTIFTTGLFAQKSDWNFHIGFETAYPSKGTSGGISSNKMQITAPTNGSVYYTMRTKMPAGLVAGVEYHINDHLYIRYQYKYSMRNFFL